MAVYANGNMLGCSVLHEIEVQLRSMKSIKQLNMLAQSLTSLDFFLLTPKYEMRINYHRVNSHSSAIYFIFP